MRNAIQEIMSSIVMSIKDNLSHSALLLNLSLSPFIYTVVSYYLYKDLHDANSVFYMLLGAGAMGVWESTLLGGAGSLREEKEQGILEYYLCTPSSLLNIIFGKCVVSVIIGLIVLLEIFLLVFTQIDISAISINYFKFSVAIVLLLFSFSTIGYFLSFLFLLLRSFVQLSNILTDSIKFFCGVLFPITVLPYGFKAVSVLLPPTWGVEIVRTSLNNSISYLSFNSAFVRVLASCSIYMIIAVLLFKLIERKIRKLGELSKI